jgi:hypothetical protein
MVVLLRPAHHKRRRYDAWALAALVGCLVLLGPRLLGALGGGSGGGFPVEQQENLEVILHEKDQLIIEKEGELQVGVSPALFGHLCTALVISGQFWAFLGSFGQISLALRGWLAKGGERAAHCALRDLSGCCCPAAAADGAIWQQREPKGAFRML